MAVYLIRFNPRFADQKQTLELGGSSFQLRTRWSARNSCFYMDLLDEDNNVLIAGERLTPYTELFAGSTAFPGQFMPLGEDPYTQDQLGGLLGLLYIEPTNA